MTVVGTRPEIIGIQENNKPPLFAPDYIDTNVSVKVVKLIQSYTKIINQTVGVNK